MRKYLRRRINEIFTTLEEAHREIGKFLKQKDTDTAVGIMAQCQEAAAAIGTAIENSEGEGTQTVGYLENYFDTLYRLSEKLDTDSEINIYELETELNKAKSSFSKEISEKIEIAFFPYKASMWDSLESVWLAAKEDERCECYVVPIPYYDRNSDGSFGTMHYEGGQFPDYVPVTDWQDYNPAESLPDIAYIHYPYDQYNMVTSVHPKYYSSELKKHTSLLVYIPYYSTSGDMSYGQRSLPAYYHSDIVIIQSEWHRKFFDQALPPTKLLPLGSPKFDRAIRLSKEKPEPPYGWKDKMKGKTVYFFNTSIGGLLQSTITYLKKIEYVFRCFIGRDNALLLWRPHPLLESTLDSMRPQFKEYYLKLKRFFIENRLGIYDDTPDIDISIAWSDAYIGDSGTSVTSLFAMAGKPLFILNNNLDREPDPEDLTTLVPGSKLYIEGNTAWFVASYSLLFKLEVETGKIDPVCKLSDMTVERYRDIVKIGDRIYAGPTNSQDIAVVENGNLRKVVLKKLNTRPGSFVNLIKYKHFLYLIPGRYPALVRYNTQTDELFYYTECLKEFTGAEDGMMFQHGACIRGHMLYVASAFNNRILIFNLETGKYTTKKIGSKADSGCWTMADDGTDFWILPVNGNTVIRWNPDTGEVCEYSQYPHDFRCKNFEYGFDCQDRPFSSAVCFDDYVLLVPLWSNMFIKIDKQTGKTSRWDTPFDMRQTPKNCYYRSYSSFSNTIKTGSSSFITFSNYDRVLYQIDVEKGECRRHQYQIDIEFLRNNEPGFNQHSEWLQYVCMESALNTLPRFLEGKLFGKPFDKQRQYELYTKISSNIDGTCGEKVHDRIMKEFIKRIKRW